MRAIEAEAGGHDLPSGNPQDWRQAGEAIIVSARRRSSPAIVVIVTFDLDKRPGRGVLTLEQLRNPTDAECAGFDLATVDLACAVDLPGSWRIDVPACLAWLDHAAAWPRQ